MLPAVIGLVLDLVDWSRLHRWLTLSRYDYLEFTDVAGNKTRFDHKVNTDKWPLSKVFSAGPQLHFLFHSDSSNNEWGYKFRVPFCYLFFSVLAVN